MYRSVNVNTVPQTVLRRVKVKRVFSGNIPNGISYVICWRKLSAFVSNPLSFPNQPLLKKFQDVVQLPAIHTIIINISLRHLFCAFLRRFLCAFDKANRHNSTWTSTTSWPPSGIESKHNMQETQRQLPVWRHLNHFQYFKHCSESGFIRGLVFSYSWSLVISIFTRKRFRPVPVWGRL